jgi:hypothetical protein
MLGFRRVAIAATISTPEARGSEDESKRSSRWGLPLLSGKITVS